jgi:hypothetical protein
MSRTSRACAIRLLRTSTWDLINSDIKSPNSSCLFLAPAAQTLTDYSGANTQPMQ